jgi:hypothetical protein
MMPVRTGCAVARFFQRIARFLQPLTDRPSGSLGAMLNRLARFYRSFLNGLASFLYWTLILGSHCKRYAE